MSVQNPKQIGRRGHWVGGTAVGAFALAMAVSSSGVAEGPVKHTSDACQNAYAILGWLKATDEQQAERCEELDKVCRAKPKVEKTATCTEWRTKCWVKHRLTPKPEQVWRKVGFIVAARPFWTKVSEYEAGRAQQIAFRQYGVSGRDDVTAFVARCGAGSTCNAFADTFYRWYRHIGIPAVFCGPLPYMLDRGTTPSVYEPTQEEIDSMNSSAGSYSSYGGGVLDEPSVDDF